MQRPIPEGINGTEASSRGQITLDKYNNEASKLAKGKNKLLYDNEIKIVLYLLIVNPFLNLDVNNKKDWWY